MNTFTGHDAEVTGAEWHQPDGERRYPYLELNLRAADGRTIWTELVFNADQPERFGRNLTKFGIADGTYGCQRSRRHLSAVGCP